MYIVFATFLFIVSYLIQLLLCFKTVNKHIRLIPLYLCVLGEIYSILLYVEFFGLYDDGSWMSLKAVIYSICLAIIASGLFVAKITYSMAKRRNIK